MLSISILAPLLNQSQTIEIFEDHVSFTNGGDKIIISKEAYEQLNNTQNNPKIQRYVRRTFETIEKDGSVENFGLTPSLDDETPLVQIQRDDFFRLSQPPEIIDGETRRRKQKNRATVIVLKPWVDASNHKWSFEWNGVPISAYVQDDEFMSRVKNHEIRFGNGDALDVDIECFQEFDSERDVWMNDTSTFAVVEVYAYLPSGRDAVIFKP